MAIKSKNSKKPIYNKSKTEIPLTALETLTIHTKIKIFCAYRFNRGYKTTKN